MSFNPPSFKKIAKCLKREEIDLSISRKSKIVNISFEGLLMASQEINVLQDCFLLECPKDEVALKAVYFLGRNEYPKKASKERKPNSTINDEKNYGFKSLKSGKNQSEIFYNTSLRTPKEIGKDIAKALVSTADILKKYQEIKITLKSDEEEHNYYHYLLNLSYLLLAPRAELDKETRTLSLFSDDNKEVQSLVSFLTERLNIIGEEKARKLHEEPIKDYYLKALYSVIAHAELEKSDYGKKGSAWSLGGRVINL